MLDNDNQGGGHNLIGVSPVGGCVDPYMYGFACINDLYEYINDLYFVCFVYATY